MALKAELIEGINQLSPRSLFDLVVYNFQGNTQIWKTKPQPGTPAKKAEAKSWIEGLTNVEDHCMEEAMLETIGLSNDCRRRFKRMIFMGNREPFCGWSSFGDNAYGEQVLESVTSANVKRTPIDTIYVPEWTTEEGAWFWEDLAAANNGKYTLVVGNGFNND
ncbi:MAG: hypothetical protein L0Z55_07995 [Planctomycetes bacterium]|nr:hypothetical protein [Planctomycetota bacterium]